jgi:hypothetical protein
MNHSTYHERANFIASRLKYLEEVQHLLPGWISSGADSSGETPNNVAINAAKKIFLQLFPLKEISRNLEIRAILMSPLVSGGISIEAKTAGGEILLICDIGNCGNVNLQLRKDGIWSEVETDVVKAEDQMEELLHIQPS